MRISDWSSDVCSSDLRRDALRIAPAPEDLAECRMEPALELLLGADRLSAARRADGLDGRHPDLPRCRRVQYGGRSLHPPLPGRSARRAADGRCLSYRRAAAAILARKSAV